MSDKYLFSIAAIDFDYAAMAFAYFFDYTSKIFIEKTVINPFGMGCKMSDTVRGDVFFRNKSMNVSFTEDKEYTKIYVESPNFKDDLLLKAEFFVEHPKNQETLNVVVPWGKKRFQYTSKQNCLPVIGTVTIGGEIFHYNTGEGFATLDFGRGIWPHTAFWNWATASGKHDGRIIGLNLGGGWTNGTGMTENAVLFDRRINKISDDVMFYYNPNNIMKPWKIKSQNTSQVNIVFEPFYERVAATNALIIKSEVHQLFGRFSGKVVLDRGEEIKLEGILGCAEEHRAKW
jgi:hypothetical protein